METLIQMYKINSKSGHEQQLQAFIRTQLDKIGIKYFIDEYNQTYNLSHKDKPLLSAHADQVGAETLKHVEIKQGILSGNCNLGADDKNGCWLILELLKKYPDLNFVFSNQEEIGGNIQYLLEQEQASLESIPYALVFDRKGKGDIVGTKNDYCVSEFEDDISTIGKEYGFKPAYGVWSDADKISDYLSCVNLSCGYYNAHTDNEYTVISELLNSLEYAKAIIENITDYYPAPDKDYGYDYGYDWLDRDTIGWETSSIYEWEEEDTAEEVIICPVCQCDMYLSELEEEGYHCLQCQENLYPYFIE